MGRTEGLRLRHEFIQEQRRDVHADHKGDRQAHHERVQRRWRVPKWIAHHDSSHAGGAGTPRRQCFCSASQAVGTGHQGPSEEG